MTWCGRSGGDEPPDGIQRGIQRRNLFRQMGTPDAESGGQFSVTDAESGVPGAILGYHFGYQTAVCLAISRLHTNDQRMEAGN